MAKRIFPTVRGMEDPSRQAAVAVVRVSLQRKTSPPVLGAWRTLAFNRQLVNVHESHLEDSGVRECVEIAGK
jgi:hypothetical protein